MTNNSNESRDAGTEFLADVLKIRETIDRRYDELVSESVTPMTGEEAFEQLRQKSQEYRLKKSSSF
jgi:hypothetical protein